MKSLFFCLLFAIGALQVQAQDRWLYWKYKDYNGSMSFKAPRMAIATGSLFLKQKSDRKLLRKVHNVSTMIFEDGSPVSNRDIRRFERKARRRNLDELITVKDGDEQVRILAKSNRKSIRKLVIMVNSPEDGFVMVSIKGKLKFSDINKVIKRYEGKKSLPKIPDLIQLPTDRA